MSMHSAIALSKSLKTGDLLTAHRMLREGADVNGMDLDHWTPMHVAAYAGQATAIFEMIRCGGDPNVVNDADETPLHLAARQGHREAVEILLDHHAAIHTHSQHGQTPLSEATSTGHKELVRYLRRRMNQRYVKQFADVVRGFGRMFKRRHDDVQVA